MKRQVGHLRLTWACILPIVALENSRSYPRNRLAALWQPGFPYREAHQSSFTDEPR